MRERQAGACARVSRAQRLHVAGRQAEALQQRPHLRHNEHALEPQQAVGPARHAAIERSSHRKIGSERCGAVEARVHAVLRVDDAVEEPGRVARGFARDLWPAFEQRAAPAVPGERPGRCAAGEAGADDQRVRLARVAAPAAQWRTPWRKQGSEPQADKPATGRVGKHEPGARQVLVHHAVGQRSIECRARRRETGQRLAEAQRVDRRHAADAERVDLGDQLAQPGSGVARREQQLDLAGVEHEALQIGRLWRPRTAQCGVHLGGRQRAWLDRDEDEPRAALRVLAPGLPRGDEALAAAEVGVEHDEAFSALPPLRQATASGRNAHAARASSQVSRRSRASLKPRYASTAPLMLASAACS